MTELQLHYIITEIRKIGVCLKNCQDENKELKKQIQELKQK